MLLLVQVKRKKNKSARNKERKEGSFTSCFLSRQTNLTIKNPKNISIKLLKNYSGLSHHGCYD